MKRVFFPTIIFLLVAADGAQAQLLEQPVAEPVTNADCTVDQEECASSCYPLPGNWTNYRECLTELCKIQDNICIEALLDRLE